MSERARILVADDEETFLRSTVALLREEGFECDAAPDALVAAEMLRARPYDLLVADIKMPGNPELELIHELSDIADGMPVILVTGYPSVRSATRSLQLPVIAYMLKPLAIEDLLAEVRKGVKRCRIYRRIHAARRSLEDWRQDLQDFEDLMRLPSTGGTAVPISPFLDLCVHNIISSLMDIKQLTEAVVDESETPGACHLLTCPQVKLLSEAIMKAIVVLHGTKSSFKSKALGDLRTELQQVIANKDNWISREGSQESTVSSGTSN